MNFCQWDTILEKPRINLSDRCQMQSRSNGSNWKKKKVLKVYVQLLAAQLFNEGVFFFFLLNGKTFLLGVRKLLGECVNRHDR